jgi:hypothetical protein
MYVCKFDFRSTRKTSREDLKDNENLIFGGFRLISLKCRCGCGLVVYKEKSLGSSSSYVFTNFVSRNIKIVLTNFILMFTFIRGTTFGFRSSYADLTGKNS